jgi:hypothetical protein
MTEGGAEHAQATGAGSKGGVDPVAYQKHAAEGEAARLLACAAICAGVAALAGCGNGAPTFHTPAYKNGYDCGSGDTGATADHLADAIRSCRSLVGAAGDSVTPKSDFNNGVSDGWHVRHGF